MSREGSEEMSVETVEEGSVEGSEEGSEEIRETTRTKVLRLLKEDQHRTAKYLSKLIGVTDRAIEKHLAKLQDNGKLERIGPNKGGY